MCTKTVFHPTGPCCSHVGLCQRWPGIDWRRAGWLVRIPNALWREVRFAKDGYPGSPKVQPDGETEYWAYNAASPLYDSEPSPGDEVLLNLLFSHHSYFVRGGEYRSSHAGSCRWSVQCRERLCPGSASLMLVNLPGIIWFVSHQHFVPMEFDWIGARGPLNHLSDPITGPFAFVDMSWLTETWAGNADAFISWRNILKAAECSFLPSLQVRGLEYGNDSAVEGGLLSRLNSATDLLRRLGTEAANVPEHSWYRPTAMDLSVAWTLSGGLSFGIESDQRSPLWNQFTIFEGGLTDTDGETSWATETPWVLTSGSDVVAQFGVVNRFERTDDNDTLPRWVELELVRL